MFNDSRNTSSSSDSGIGSSSWGSSRSIRSRCSNGNSSSNSLSNFCGYNH